MLKIDFGSGYSPRKGYSTCDITYSPFLDYVYDIQLNDSNGRVTTIIPCSKFIISEEVTYD